MISLSQKHSPSSISGSTQLGFFKSHSATNPSKISITDFVELIRNPDPDIIKHVAEAGRAYSEAGGGRAGKDAAKPFKSKLSCVTMAATGTRKEPEIATGLLNVDFDELGDRFEVLRSKLLADPHIVIGPFISPSGDGLKAAIRVPLIPNGPVKEMQAQHAKNFEAVQNFCTKSFGIPTDSATSDILRLCYVSNDPECRLNLDARELDVAAWAPPEVDPKARRAQVSKNGSPKKVVCVSRHIVEALLASIATRPARKEWLAISAAVRNSLGDDTAAIEILKKWSPEEEVGEYAELLKKPFDEIGIGTLAYHAGENGYTGVIRNFFYAGKGGFAMRSERGYIPLTSETAVRQHLKQYRIPTAIMGEMLCRIREEQLVHHIGSIAGHQPGLHEFNGDRFLVTRGPKIIVGQRETPIFLYSLLRDMLHDDQNPEQFKCFLAWLAHCIRAVVGGKRRQTPALALTGPIGNGKSLTIEIIKRCLGGRSEKAYQFFSGDEKFNAELAGAELLVSDDDAVSRDRRSRVQLAQSIKANLFSNSMRVRGMHSAAFSCAPVHAVVIAANSDPEHLRVLPELDDSMRDKIMLMKTKAAILPPDVAGRDERISQMVDADLPAFVSLLDEMDLTTFYDERGRLKCFWHPEIVEALGLLAPETQFKDLLYQVDVVQRVIAASGKWVGTAAGLQEILTSQGSGVQQAARSLLAWPTACGTFLGRLAGVAGSGVTKGPKDSNKIQTYIIATPISA